MCTVSWTAVGDGYDLFFNRDELHTRGAESPPAVEVRTGVRYLAPSDGDHGGTWLAANEFGLTVCLLNDYGAPWRPQAVTRRFSRGHLVRRCAAASNHAEVLDAVRMQPLARTMPFQLLALSPREGAMTLKWQGYELIRHEGMLTTPLLTSSSFATDEVIETRIRRFGSFVRAMPNAERAELHAYHHQHDPQAGAHSVLMSRPDAATRSICHVRITAHTVQLSYAAVAHDGFRLVIQVPVMLTFERRTPVAIVA